ncbi:MAG: hypothetical protein CMJ26_05340 [Phycisphaerae bacterium]|nr:hypothetical protein [Phycisphaerae bacterium]|tara:strand:+ start:10412 stop:13288 length:2877 start_codon:yes stop_codon:yes gene_type:complete
MLLPIQFDRPGWLLLLLLLVPVIYLAWGGLTRSGARSRAVASTVTRCIIVILLATAIAKPVWEKKGEGVTVIAVLDRSQSIPRSLQMQSVDAFQQWTAPDRRGEHNRLAVISVGRDAVIGSMPSEATIFEPAANEPIGSATNLAKGVQLALALLPQDTASRILVVSDGNETDGHVANVASIAKANGVPIDVLPLQYDHQQEVMIEKVVVPSQTRIGQSIPVRIILRSVNDARGTLHLLQNDIEINISDVEGKTGLPLALTSGVNALVFDIPIQTSGPQMFEAMWVPVSNSDTITANNTGLGVSFVSQGGLVLLVTQNQSASSHLQALLESAGIQIEVRNPQEVPRDSIGFSAFDAVVLADIPRWSLDDLQEQNLFTFVHDVGGGLLMTGGPNAFGAGGWIGSKLEQAMPLKCEPPQTRQLPRGALALIMHSCEMPEGNYWGQKMAMAAVDSLSELDYVGIIEYDWNGGVGTLNNSGWTLPLSLAGDKVQAHDAIHSLVFGDMQDFESPMQIALDGLAGLDAAQRHVIIITDGDPSGPSQELLEAYRSHEVTISTVMVGGHGSAMDQQKMQGIATVTGGRFYMVNDPNTLPSIFIKEAQLNSRSLLQEGGTWEVALQPSISGPVRDIRQVPQLGGYVVTGNKAGFAQTPWVVPVSDGEDPLFAWWHFGLGKSVAFTSDLGDRWATQWPSWSGFQEFWEATLRWLMRGASPPNMMVTSKVEGGRGIVDIEAVDDEAGFVNFMRSKAVVINPDGEAETLSLQQTGPGRYHAEFDAPSSGAWLVNIAFQNGDGELTGRIPTAVTVPYAQEYSSTTANDALLHELARNTGGRVLSFLDLESVNLFDETDAVFPESPQPFWDLLAILAASVLILDVAIRRLWMDKKSMQSILAPVGSMTTGSVEALRKVHKPIERSKEELQDERVPKIPMKQEDPRTEESNEEKDDNLSQLLKNKRKRSGGDKE